MGSTRTRKAAQVSRERRFLVDHLNAPSVELTGDEAHHLIHVLRLSTGDEVALFDGRGTAQSARVTSIHTDKVELEDFEAAAELRDQIHELEGVTS